MTDKCQDCTNASLGEMGKTNQKFFQFIFLIAVLLGILASFHSVIPESLASLAVYGLLGCGYSGIILFFFVYRGSVPESKLLAAWSIIGVYLLLVGFVFGNPLSPETRSTFLHQDIRYFMYTTLGIIVSRKEFRPWILKVMTFMGYLSIIFGVLSLVNITPTTTAMARMQVWTLPYFFWWLSGSCFAINYAYMRMTGKNKVAGIGAMAAYIICGVMFLKKVVIVNSLLLVLICELLAPDSKIRNGSSLSRFFKGLLSLTVIIGLMGFLATEIEPLQNIIELIMDRFRQATSSFDRYVEFKIYLKDTSPLKLIVGQGFGNYVYLRDQYVDGYYQANAMHIGLADISYVGGIPYCFVWIAILSSVIKRIRFVKTMDDFQRACFAVVSLSCISLFYEFSRSNYISPFFAAIAFSTVLSFSDKSSDKLLRRAQSVDHENML